MNIIPIKHSNESLNIHGILLINKPSGLSSNAVLQQVKRLYKAKKAGHTGSLDPLATGMLPLCFGEATKFCQYLLDADKYYQATALLGVKTSTGDSCGDIIEKADSFSVNMLQIQSVIEQFVGSIQQVPSMFSALKHQGIPLYKLARQGLTIERKSRHIVIHAIKLLSFDGHQFTITVSCSKGTYIRNLVEDIGDKLGVYAHVTQLHRIHTNGFANDKMYTLDELMTNNSNLLLDYLLPLERAVAHLPLVALMTMDEVVRLRQGKMLTYDKQGDISGCVRLHDPLGYFIGLGELHQDRRTLVARRLLAS